MRALLLCLLLIGCGGNDDVDDKKSIAPPDCVNHPEQCK